MPVTVTRCLQNRERGSGCVKLGCLCVLFAPTGLGRGAQGCRVAWLPWEKGTIGSFNRNAVEGFRSEGPAVNSPVRQGGERHLSMAQRPLEDRGAGTNPAAPSALRQLPVASTPPSRTGLLTAGPSDLGVQIDPVATHS